MKPILIIGPGSSRLRYSIEIATGRILVTCPVCGATAIAEADRPHVTSMVEHEPDCEWLASVERAAGVNRKDGRSDSVN